MIFLCVGSREYQFNRLLKEMDILIKDKQITEEVFAQIGQSTYIPQNYLYEKFLDSNVFKEYQRKADIIISHGGTGALIGALKENKQVIAVPRLSSFAEHIDDHQLQVSKELEKQGYLKCVIDINDLIGCITDIKENPIEKRFDYKSNVKSIIEDFLESV